MRLSTKKKKKFFLIIGNIPLKHIKRNKFYFERFEMAGSEAPLAGVKIWAKQAQKGH